jgi:hypothetical protein
MDETKVMELITLGVDLAERIAKLVGELKAQQGITDEQLQQFALTKDQGTRDKVDGIPGSCGKPGLAPSLRPKDGKSLLGALSRVTRPVLGGGSMSWFQGKKTYIAAILLILLAAAGVYLGEVDQFGATILIVFALGFIGVRDSIARSSRRCSCMPSKRRKLCTITSQSQLK